MKQLVLSLCALTVVLSTHAATLSRAWQVEDTDLLSYFRRETRAIADKCLTDLTTSNAWLGQVPQRRAELAEMLGLSPMPERTDMHAVVTKRFDAGEFTIENLHFQSRPGLYVTANLYIPKGLTKPAPTILYLCGHSPVITNKVSYGTKVAYQHWGSWLARNRYVCLVVDTLESGEILGEHHGTYNKGMWWWNSRGYTPAGVECWNGIRALDYLSTRPEVDTNRFGVTGRSGGGAYSWYITAMDDRIKASAPTAGITDLENHVVDGAVEGHCDCMFFVNTYRWDYPQLAAMAAPRPLFIVNTDDDVIFPLDGVVRLRDKVRRVYDLFGAGEKCGLVIGPGGHKDTQDIQVPVMRWFNKHLKGADTPVENYATKLFTPQQLKVFETLPSDALNAKIHETFVRTWSASVPRSKKDWDIECEVILQLLAAKTFPSLARKDESDTVHVFNRVNGHHQWQFADLGANLFVGTGADEKAERVILKAEFFKPGGRKAPRTPGAWHAQISFPRHDTNALANAKRSVSERADRVDVAALLRKDVQIRRRHMLLGQTVDAVNVVDLVRAIRAVRATETLANLPLRLEAEGDVAVNALYASLFAPVDELVLTNLPNSHQDGGPDYLNVLRFIDIPQAVAMASERCKVELRGANEADWSYAREVTRRLGWEKHLRIEAK